MSVRLHIQNFQSIKDADLIVEHLTVVTGTNNTGKTAVQRAARGVFQNTGGTAFIRHGERKCSVLVDFGEDGSVLWTKGTGKRDRPTYVVNGGKPIFPGSSVPDEVLDFGVRPISCAGQDIWPTVAPQFTGQVFLLDKPGSALAEAVADVERVSQLNTALRRAESDKRKATARLGVRREDLVKNEADVAAFDGLDDALVAVELLAAKRESLVRIERAVEMMTGLRDDLNDAEHQVGVLSPIKDVRVPDQRTGKNLGALLDEHQALQNLRERWGEATSQVALYEPLRGLQVGGDASHVRETLKELEALYDLRNRWQKAKDEVAAFQGLRGISINVGVIKPQRLSQALDILHALRDRLRREESSVEDLKRQLKEAQADLEAANVEANAVLEELGVCPTCGSATGDT